MSSEQPSRGTTLDYASAKRALDALVGRRVTARIEPQSGGATVASIGVGYLQPPGEFGQYPRTDETTVYQITEQPEPTRGYHYPFWPSIHIHDVPDFRAWTNGARVDCAFSGVIVTVELAISDEWLTAERTFEN
jgi:hypothetical protein